MSASGTDTILAQGDLLQVLVELGKELDRHVALAPFGGRRRMPPSERPASLSRITALEVALDERIHRESAKGLRRTLRVRPEEVTPLETMRILAVTAHRQLVTGRPPMGVGATARVAGLDQTAETLEARVAIRKMIAWGVLTFVDGNLGDGDLRLSRRAVRGLSGGGLDIVWSEASLKQDLARGSAEDQMRAFEREARKSHERERAIASMARAAPPPLAGSLQPTASARQLFEALRRTVIGMDSTVMEFASAMVSHSRRVAMIKAGQPVPNPKTLLLCGNSGSGKTLLARTYAQVCGYHHVCVDLSTVTASGYVGESVPDAFETLWNKAGGAAGMLGGVIIWDEIDKRAANRGAVMDVSGRSVQQELLKLIESSGGVDYRVGGRNCFSALSGTFDPSSLCHIFCGAFTGLAELAKKRLGRSKSIGFGDHSPTGGRTDIRSLLNEFGLLTELTNRIERVILMPPVTVDTLAEIAGAPNGIINQQNAFTASFGLKLVLTAAAVHEMCEWALHTETLARGIRSVLSRLGDEAMAAELTGEIKVNAADVRRAIEADGETLLG